MRLRELVGRWVTRWQTRLLVYSCIFPLVPLLYRGIAHHSTATLWGSAWWCILGSRQSKPTQEPIPQSYTGLYLIRVFLSQHLILLLTWLSLLYQLSDLTKYVKHPRSHLRFSRDGDCVFGFSFFCIFGNDAQEETRERKKIPCHLNSVESYAII